LGLEAEAVDVVDDLAQIVAALDAVLYLAENFADFVFDGVGPGGLLLKAVQVGEELGVDELDEVVAPKRCVMVDLTVSAFRRRPCRPAVGLIEDVGVFFPSRAASVALSTSRVSRYLRKRSQEDCSV
jgi:hypothetical protein